MKAFKFFTIAIFATIVTGCASQQPTDNKLSYKEACLASGGTMDFGTGRIKSCQHPVIDDSTTPPVHSIGYTSLHIVRGR